MNKIDKEKMMPYVKLFGIWAVYYVILGLINTKITLNASSSPELTEKYVRSTTSLIIPILMMLPFLGYFVAGVVALIRMLIGYLKKKDTTKAKKMASDCFIFLAVFYLIGGFYYNIFPDHVLNNLNKINIENNKQNIESKLSKEEIDQITAEVKKDNAIYPIIVIKDTDCLSAKKEATASGKTKNTDIVKNLVENCQNSDIEVTIGRSYYCGPTCGQGYKKYYLVRKVDNVWKIIKVLGESKWAQ